MFRSTLVLLTLAFSVSATAADFDYNFLTLGYGTTDFDDVNVDGDGFGIGGSYAINEDYHVFGGYSSADLDFNIDATMFSAGIGFNRGMSEVVDFVAQLSYEYVELDAPGVTGADDNGLGLGVGLRVAANEMLELNAGIQYIDLSDSGSDTGFSAGGLYSFTDAFALGLFGDWSDDVSSYTLSGRFYFGD